jgi:hypothetical protein
MSTTLQNLNVGIRQTELLSPFYPAKVPPRTRPGALIARLERIKLLADDLARVQGGETPAGRALADRIKQDIDIVRRALKRQKP